MMNKLIILKLSILIILAPNILACSLKTRSESKYLSELVSTQLARIDDKIRLVESQTNPFRITTDSHADITAKKITTLKTKQTKIINTWSGQNLDQIIANLPADIKKLAVSGKIEYDLDTPVLDTRAPEERL